MICFFSHVCCSVLLMDAIYATAVVLVVQDRAIHLNRPPHLGVHVGRERVLRGLQEEVHVLPLGRVVVGPGGLDQGLLEVG